jgi:hypothetical protein
MQVTRRHHWMCKPTAVCVDTTKSYTAAAEFFCRPQAQLLFRTGVEREADMAAGMRFQPELHTGYSSPPG